MAKRTSGQEENRTQLRLVDFSDRPGCDQGSDLDFHVACMCVT